MRTVQAGRERLASVPSAHEQGTELPGELGDDAWLESEGLFDQDLE